MNPFQTQPLLSAERRAISAYGVLMSARMLGLFMVLPVFALYGGELGGATPVLIGLAIGVYGLFQALLQIPFGVLSDRIGRKPMLLVGLTMFLLGGLVAAQAEHIATVIIGRALQGAGAIASVVMASVADATREEQRTKAMAMIGMSIGASFVLSLVVGPLVAAKFKLSGLFYLTSILAFISMLIVLFVVPSYKVSYRNDAQSSWRTAWGNKQLRQVSYGVFILHAVLTAIFLVLPLSLLNDHGLAASKHSAIYLPMMILSFFAMVPFIIMGEKKRRMKWVMVAAVVAMLLAELLLFASEQSLVLVYIALFAFFFGFNLLEAVLPSLVSKLAPIGQKGGSMGMFSSAQFLGAFVGGVAGGVIYQAYGVYAVFAVSVVLLLFWLVLVLLMSEPPSVSSLTLRIDNKALTSEQVEQQLIELEGVEEVVFVDDGALVIVKADKKKVDYPTLQSIISGK